MDREKAIALEAVTTEDLERELARRGRTVSPTLCWKCGVWSARVMVYDGWGEALHCEGCLKRCERCTCRR